MTAVESAKMFRQYCSQRGEQESSIDSSAAPKRIAPSDGSLEHTVDSGQAPAVRFSDLGLPLSCDTLVEALQRYGGGTADDARRFIDEYLSVQARPSRLSLIYHTSLELGEDFLKSGFNIAKKALGIAAIPLYPVIGLLPNDITKKLFGKNIDARERAYHWGMALQIIYPVSFFVYHGLKNNKFEGGVTAAVCVPLLGSLLLIGTQSVMSNPHHNRLYGFLPLEFAYQLAVKLPYKAASSICRKAKRKIKQASAVVEKELTAENLKTIVVDESRRDDATMIQKAGGND
ncbi:MAG: hypothetical protein V1659_01040 [Candidatus Woesearchaeota archaeon]